MQLSFHAEFLSNNWGWNKTPTSTIAVTIPTIERLVIFLSRDARIACRQGLSASEGHGSPLDSWNDWNPQQLNWFCVLTLSSLDAVAQPDMSRLCVLDDTTYAKAPMTIWAMRSPNRRIAYYAYIWYDEWLDKHNEYKLTTFIDRRDSHSAPQNPNTPITTIRDPNESIAITISCPAKSTMLELRVQLASITRATPIIYILFIREKTDVKPRKSNIPEKPS